jgi:hypothetical protein
MKIDNFRGIKNTAIMDNKELIRNDRFASLG